MQYFLVQKHFEYIINRFGYILVGYSMGIEIWISKYILLFELEMSNCYSCKVDENNQFTIIRYQYKYFWNNFWTSAINEI